MFQGVINLNKPPGITSQGAVSRIKKLFGVNRAGHTGTLDPQVSGVLVVCLGKATKIAPFLITATKAYKCTLALGIETDTQDAWGKVVKSSPVPGLDSEQVETALRSFQGEMEQVPPMYSAVKLNGKRLYQLARKGISVDRKSREIRIYSIELEEFSSPTILFNVVCSSGTYVRTICHDLGILLGCGAHLVALERTSVGLFNIEEAFTLERLEHLTGSGRGNEAIISMDRALSFLPSLTVKEEYVERVQNGMGVQVGWTQGDQDVFNSGDIVRVKSPDCRLLAIVEALMDSRLMGNREQDAQALKMKRVLVA